MQNELEFQNVARMLQSKHASQAAPQATIIACGERLRPTPEQVTLISSSPDGFCVLSQTKYEAGDRLILHLGAVDAHAVLCTVSQRRQFMVGAWSISARFTRMLYAVAPTFLAPDDVPGYRKVG